MIKTEEGDRRDWESRSIELGSLHASNDEHETAILVQNEETSSSLKFDRSKQFFGFLPLSPRDAKLACTAHKKSAAVILAGTVGMILIVALWLALVPKIATSADSCTLEDYQQPAAVIKPSAYTNSFFFDTDNFEANASLASQEFQGMTTISFTVLNDTDSIPLHSVGMTFLGVNLTAGNEEPQCLCGPGCNVTFCDSIVVNASTPEECPSSEVVMVSLEGMLVSGEQANLSLAYTGQFNPGSGVYRSNVFNTEEGDDPEQSVLIVTQLESTGARSFFPCVDETASKANFTVDMTYPMDMVGLANMPPLPTSSQMPGGLVRQEYETTPTMSTYLLAICIGYIVPMHSQIAEGINVSVWSVPLLQDQLSFPLQMATGALEFYTQYTGVAQPLKKFDMAAVPGKGSAMENWGLLLYDEARFLVNNETEGAYGQWLSADVICHEVAHQWFGNLVTCEDFTQITMNEGVASFMEYQCIHQVLPNASAAALMRRATSPMRESIGIHEGVRDTALLADQEPFTAPLITSLSASLQPTGEVTYSKGAAILMMLEAYFDSLQPAAFQAEMGIYLKAHLYGNAAASDFIGSMAASSVLPSSINRTAFEETWLLWFYQPGIPQLYLATEDQGMPVSLQRFLDFNGSDESPQPWAIPLGFEAIRGGISDGGDVMRLLIQSNNSLLNPGPGSELIINTNASGLYRVSYPTNYTSTLTAWLNNLEPGNEEGIFTAAAILGDSCAFLHQGSANASDFLSIARAISSSPAFNSTLGYYSLAGTLLDCMSRLQQMVVLSDSCIAGINNVRVNLTAKLVNETLERLPDAFSNAEYEQIPFMLKLGQADILRDAALSGNDDAVSFLCSEYNQIMQGGASGLGIDHPDLRGAFYSVASARPTGCNLEQSSDEVFEGFMDCWVNTVDIAESRRCLFAMAFTLDASQREALLTTLLDADSQPKTISSSDTNALLNILSSSPAGAEDVWNNLSSRLRSATSSMSGSDTEDLISSLWGYVEVVQLPPRQRVLQAVIDLSQADPESTLGLSQLKVQGRLRHNIMLQQSKVPELCSLVPT